MKINLDKILLFILLSTANGLSACEDSGSVSHNQEFTLIIGQKISDDETADKIIELNRNLSPKEMDFERYKIQFVGLDPYPVLNKKIQPENYRIRVIVKSL